MVRHTELLRLLKQISPDLANRFINAWGTIELHVLVDDIVKGRNKKIAVHLNAKLAELLMALEADHREQFAQFAHRSADKIPEDLADDADYLLLRPRFPHIGDTLALVWATDRFHRYMDSLLNSGNRPNRQGFPVEYARALAHLRQKHDQRYPRVIPRLEHGFNLYIE